MLSEAFFYGVELPITKVGVMSSDATVSPFSCAINNFTMVFAITPNGC